jgi:hypothetical protein
LSANVVYCICTFFLVLNVDLYQFLGEIRETFFAKYSELQRIRILERKSFTIYILQTNLTLIHYKLKKEVISGIKFCIGTYAYVVLLKVCIIINLLKSLIMNIHIQIYLYIKYEYIHMYIYVYVYIL